MTETKSPPVPLLIIADENHGEHAYHKVIPMAMTHSMAFPFFCIECEVAYAVLFKVGKDKKLEVWKVVHKVESACARCEEEFVTHFEECQADLCETCREELEDA